MAELVDALDLGSSVLRRESSSLSSRTIFFNFYLISKLIVVEKVFLAFCQLKTVFLVTAVLEYR